jgi:serine/threonine protein kinase
MELLGKIPLKMLHSGTLTHTYFNKYGSLRNIKKLEYWSLLDVLKKKYNFPEDEAELLCSFLLPMLELNPAKRASAAECLQHPWLIVTEKDREGKITYCFFFFFFEKSPPKLKVVLG